MFCIYGTFWGSFCLHLKSSGHSAFSPAGVDPEIFGQNDPWLENQKFDPCNWNFYHPPNYQFLLKTVILKIFLGLGSHNGCFKNKTHSHSQNTHWEAIGPHLWRLKSVWNTSGFTPWMQFQPRNPNLAKGQFAAFWQNCRKSPHNSCDVLYRPLQLKENISFFCQPISSFNPTQKRHKK